MPFASKDASFNRQPGQSSKGGPDDCAITRKYCEAEEAHQSAHFRFGQVFEHN